MMLRCWHEDPVKRPTFTELREELERNMSQRGIYISFDFDEDSDVSEHEEHSVNTVVITDKSILVEAAIHYEHSQPMSVEESTEVTSV